jgi:hypothetical protein
MLFKLRLKKEEEEIRKSLLLNSHDSLISEEENKDEISETGSKSRVNLDKTKRATVNSDEFAAVEQQKEWEKDYIAMETLAQDSQDDTKVLELTFKEYIILFLYAIVSSSDTIAYLLFIINHAVYGSLESVFFPLSVLCYALLENPRPPSLYWKVMLIYSEMVYLAKVMFSSNLWITLYGKNYLDSYTDVAVTGLNRPDKTYSEDTLTYVFWDIACIFIILRHQYFLCCIGLWHHTEYEIESLHEAKIRNNLETEKVMENRRYSFDESLDANNVSVISSFKKFFMRVFPRQPAEKPGKDYYLSIVMIQFLILIFILCFYTKMDGEYRDISDSFTSSTFPGYLVLAILVHLIIMIADKYLYLARSTCAIKNISDCEMSDDCRGYKFECSIFLKLIFHILLIIVIHNLVFWGYPMRANYNFNDEKLYCEDMYDSTHCNNYQLNWALQIFYIIYVIYFYINAKQIRVGMPLFRKGAMKLMHNHSDFAKICFLIYKALPFIFEIRVLLDWTFTKTSLDLIKWFKLDELYGQLYLRKCNWEEIKNEEPATPQNWVRKFFIGYCLIFLLLVLILLPLFLFSSLDPFMKENPVKEIELSIGVVLDSNFLVLYKSSYLQDSSNLSKEEWKDLGIPELNGVSNSDRDNAKIFETPITSDDLWYYNPARKLSICDVQDKDLNDFQIDIRLEMSVGRNHPDYQSSIRHKYDIKVDERTTKASIRDALCISGDNIKLTKYFYYENFKSPMLKIASVGDPPQMDFFKLSSKDQFLTLRRTYDTVNNLAYWDAFITKKQPYNPEEMSVSYVIISNNYSPATFDFSAITFYVSVVYLAARITRSILGNNINNLIIEEIQNPDYLINLCEGIYVSRMAKDLVREQVLYYELIDIMRSPELIKMVTGRSSIKYKID